LVGLRAERLVAYLAYLDAVSQAELHLTHLGRDDTAEPFDPEEVGHLHEFRAALSKAHTANLNLYLLAPYLLAETGQRAIRELESRSILVLQHGQAEMNDEWWESVIDQMRDDLGTKSWIPTDDELRAAGFEPSKTELT